MQKSDEIWVFQQLEKIRNLTEKIFFLFVENNTEEFVEMTDLYNERADLLESVGIWRKKNPIFTTTDAFEIQWSQAVRELQALDSELLKMFTTSLSNLQDKLRDATMQKSLFIYSKR